MREIKFRAWDKTEKDMFTIAELGFENNLVYSIRRRGFTSTGGMFTYPKNDNVVLMQYTGIKDKKGIEIFEGDIVRILYTDWASQSDYSISLEEYKKSISKIGKIEWNEDGYWCLNFGVSKYGDDSIGGLHEGTHGEKEIIGNIYENPELLK